MNPFSPRKLGGAMLGVMVVFTAAMLVWRWLEPIVPYVVVALYALLIGCRLYYKTRMRDVPNEKLKLAYRMLLIIGTVYLVAKFGAILMITSPCTALLVLGAIVMPYAAKVRRVVGK